MNGAEKDEFLAHEVLDRAASMATIWETLILEHPLVAADAELRKRAETIAEQLGDFYQYAGSRSGE